MCTLIVGIAVWGPDSFVVAANRDEDPSRPSDPPGVLSTHPLVVGGRDRIAGGTWLAVRDASAVVAVLNRRPHDRAFARRPSAGHDADEPLRSRGLLALDATVADPDAPPSQFSASALAEAGRSTRENRYAPFSLVCVTERASWWASYEGSGTVRVETLDPGWHVLTHEDLDAASEPRTARLLRLLKGWTPASAAEAEARMLELLALHDAPAAGESSGGAPVCIHTGTMATVSSAVVVRRLAETRYLHVEGRPCTTAPSDLTSLLAGTVKADPRS